MAVPGPGNTQQPRHQSLLGPTLTRREAELLEVTLEVLRETGYDKLTVDQVVARAHASKTTVYRRWPSKAELVCAAFAHRIRGQHGLPPDSGTLRGDLLALAGIIARDAEELRCLRPAHCDSETCLLLPTKRKRRSGPCLDRGEPA